MLYLATATLPSTGDLKMLVNTNPSGVRTRVGVPTLTEITVILSRSLANEELVFGKIRIHCYVEEPDHHLIKTLLSPGYLGQRVRVSWIVRRVIEVAGPPKHGAPPKEP